MLMTRISKYLKCTMVYIIVAILFYILGGEEIQYYTSNSVPVGRSAFGQYYWIWVLLFWGCVTAYMMYSFKREREGKNTLGLYGKWVFRRYGFLIEQLVGRDFKSKYKRSVLGYLWSFLNPLMTSLVQYLVFSTLFKSDIEHFPAYLMTGTIFFGFFTEAVSQGLSAIVGNASLIMKVYVPKWIYPVTKVCASSVNFVISLIPLFVIAVATGCWPTPALLLLIYDILCLLVFCIGMALFLSALNVFFRDTQYLWGVITVAWTYATPLFYPETIVPETYRWILRLNPLYHFVKFARICIIDGVSPHINTYGYCLLSAVLMLLIGAFVFRKTQDRFALYI